MTWAVRAARGRLGQLPGGGGDWLFWSRRFR